MTSFESLVLNAESKLIPVNSLATKARARISSESASFVLSRPGSRSGALLLDDHGAQLVELFREPTTLPKALHALCKATSKEPTQLVDAVLPLLKRLVKDEHLVSSSGAARSTPSAHRTKMVAGETFRGMQILSCLQALDDTQVYKVALPDGRNAALKLLSKRHPAVVATFGREALILEALRGTTAPELFEASLEGEDIYVVIEWIAGYSLAEWCGRLRNLPTGESYRRLTDLSLAVLHAYREIHERGVLHSDVWMKNIIVDLEGRVRLIDFGGSWYPPAHAVYAPPIRAANPYFRAPDLAAAELARSERPEPTIASEIYGIGAVLYMMLTGRAYTDFSLEQDVQMKEVLSNPMIPFSQRGLVAWPDYENLLRAMLEKDASMRIQSIDDCIGRCEAVQPPSLGSSSGELAPLDPIRLLRSYANDNSDQPLPAPSASVVYGAAGLGYALLRASLVLGEPRLLNEADIMTVRARESMESGPDGAFNDEIGITEREIGALSIHHRAEGVTLLEALIAHTCNDALSLRLAALRFLMGNYAKDAPLEFAFGRAGLLNAVLQMTFLVSESEPLIKLGNELAEQMLTEVEKCNGLETSTVKFLGFAHGWAGIFFSLLAWGREHNPSLGARLLPYLNDLANQKVGTSLGAYWPKRFDRPVIEGDSPSWCNGTAGFVLLWCEAFESLEDERWLELAKEAGRATDLHPEMGYNLCCGLTGRAFSLASLYRATGDSAWIERAAACLKRAKPSRGSHLHSLFKGITGLELASAEMRQPDMMIFPLLANRQYGDPLSVGLLG